MRTYQITYNDGSKRQVMARSKVEIIERMANRLCWRAIEPV